MLGITIFNYFNRKWSSTPPITSWKEKGYDCGYNCYTVIKKERILGITFGNTGIAHFIEPCFIVLCRYCIFHKLKFCSDPASSKSISAVFPTAFALFMSQCHILIICNTSNFFIIIIFVMVICISDL